VGRGLILGGEEGKAVQTEDAKANHEKNAKLWTMVPAQFFAKRKAATKLRMDQKPPIVVIQRNAHG
jgi:DNA polymerase IIIc chi subunit